MGLDITGAKIYFEIPILGGIPITETIVNTWIVMVVIVLLCIWLTRNLQVKATTRRQVVAELIVDSATKFVRENMGEKMMGFLPFIAALFSMSALCSLSSLVGLYPPTSDLNTPLSWAIMVFVIITYMKIKTNGPIGYVKGYVKPVPVLLPFNIIGEFSTPISMAFRHFGNIVAGSIITALLYGALAALSGAVIGWIPGAIGQIPIFQAGIPALLSIYFDVFASFLQAFIFCMLTMLYISAAAETD